MNFLKACLLLAIVSLATCFSLSSCFGDTPDYKVPPTTVVRDSSLIHSRQQKKEIVDDDIKLSFSTDALPKGCNLATVVIAFQTDSTGNIKNYKQTVTCK